MGALSSARGVSAAPPPSAGLASRPLGPLGNTPPPPSWCSQDWTAAPRTLRASEPLRSNLHPRLCPLPAASCCPAAGEASDQVPCGCPEKPQALLRRSLGKTYVTTLSFPQMLRLLLPPPPQLYPSERKKKKLNQEVCV